MEFITNNLKKIGIINIILIVAVFIARCITFPNSLAIVKVESVIGVIGLIMGFIYAFNGYKKDDAKYYKWFMYIYAVNSLVSVIVPVLDANKERPLTLLTIFGIINLICICLLTFVKDFGKTKSFVSIGIVLLINVVRFISILFAANESNTSIITASLENLVLAIIAFMFVVCKFADKASRGAK